MHGQKGKEEKKRRHGASARARGGGKKRRGAYLIAVRLQLRGKEELGSGL